MATDNFPIVDYLAEARGRYTQQFKNKSVFDRNVQLLLSQSQLIETTLQQLLQMPDINQASGAQLDLIGALVGQPRVSIPKTVINYFGFAGFSGSLSFGDLNNPGTGGLFYNFNDGTAISLSDDLYRIIIRGRILANNSAATPEDVIHGIQFLVNTTFGSITEQPDAHLTVNIGEPLTPLQQYIIKGIGTGQSLVPIPVGVAVTFIQYNGGDFFAFSGVQGAQGFGDLNSLTPSNGYGAGYGNSYGLGTGPGSLLGGYFASLF